MGPIGVLALQGDFLEHIRVLRGLGVESREVRLPQQLEEIDGLIIPGGESTTLCHLMDLYHFREPLTRFANDGMPLWGTCAGMIVVANKLTDHRPIPLGLMDIHVSRNGFGRQVDSFEAELEVPALGSLSFHAVFIRAPAVCSIGPDVEVLARLEDSRPVAVLQGRRLATSFHPELTQDVRFHQMFLDMVRGRD